jgi:hypothetical protein
MADSSAPDDRTGWWAEIGHGKADVRVGDAASPEDLAVFERVLRAVNEAFEVQP